jgi:hypothetical protein
MKPLKTWGGRSSFSYSGSVETGTEIRYGSGHMITVERDDYEKLLAEFNGKAVPCGTSRDKPPMGSLGSWLQAHVTKTATASYVGAILVNEGYALRDGSTIIFV